MATRVTNKSDVVADPVGHISISGVHGRDELNDRLAHAPSASAASGSGIRRALGNILLGAAAGAFIMYLIDRNR